jgi:hypothetical protein
VETSKPVLEPPKANN